MLNETSSYFQPKLIDFTCMGLDDITSKFLNWCLQNRDNLEFIKECKTLEKVSQSSTLHTDHLKIIRRIDDTISHNRQGT
jgi:hypothetical protein